MKKIYSGYLMDEVGYEYNKNHLLLEDNFAEGLFEDIADDCISFGDYVRFQYYISDKEFDLKDLEQYLIESYYGLTDIKTVSCGCLTCGYMCIDKATIGGHDIHKELYSYIGKFAIIEIDYYKDREELLEGSKQ